MKRFLPGIIIVSLVVLITGCKKSPVDYGVVTFLMGDVKVEEKGSTPGELKMGDLVRNGVVIRTGKDSSAAIQLGDSIVVRILSDSQLTFKTILENGTTGLKLERGTALSKIDKLGKKGAYSIKTPTVTASVRGTSFLTAYEPGSSRVSVKNGTVNIESSQLKINQDIGAGKSAVVTTVVVERKIPKIDALLLRMVENVGTVEKPEEKPLEDLEKKRDGIIEKEKELLKEIEKLRPMTLSQIRRKYGRIDVVSLYTGRVVKGAIISRGNMVKMITPGGVVSFSSKKIRNTRVE
jgi:hypothetical protein